MTRILTSYEINELDNYYDIIMDRINRQKEGTYNDKQNLVNLVKFYYMNQKQEILNGKKISLFNRNMVIKWDMSTTIEMGYMDYYEYNRDYEYFFWQSDREYIYRDLKYNFKYKYFINIECYKCDLYSKEYIVSLDLVISPKSLNKERLNYIAKKNNIDIESISYSHINSVNDWRFNLYNKILSNFDLDNIIDIDNYYKNKFGYEHYGEYIECEFNPALLIKDILKEDGSLNINLSNNEFKSFYLHMLELSLIDKFIEIKDLKSQLSKNIYLLYHALYTTQKADINYLNTNYKYLYSRDFGKKEFFDNYIKQLDDFLDIFAASNNICCSCYSKEVQKAGLIFNKEEDICDECKLKYEAEMEEWIRETDSLVPQEVLESIDNMME